MHATSGPLLQKRLTRFLTETAKQARTGGKLLATLSGGFLEAVQIALVHRVLQAIVPESSPLSSSRGKALQGLQHSLFRSVSGPTSYIFTSVQEVIQIVQEPETEAVYPLCIDVLLLADQEPDAAQELIDSPETGLRDLVAAIQCTQQELLKTQPAQDECSVKAYVKPRLTGRSPQTSNKLHRGSSSRPASRRRHWVSFTAVLHCRFASL